MPRLGSARSLVPTTCAQWSTEATDAAIPPSSSGLARSRTKAPRFSAGRFERKLVAMYYATFCQMKKMLGQLDKWLDTAATYAQTKSFDPNLFLEFRLAPDQFAFARQVQVTCDTVKLAAFRLAGKEAPVQADSEKTLDELRARVRSVITYLDGFTAKDFDAAGTRVISQPRWEGKVMT